MGQQPNLELSESDLPRKSLGPAAPRRWRPTKPGLITQPDQTPGGGMFGQIGPDPGWALRLVELFELPSDDPDLKAVVSGLTVARAAAMGRGPVREDIEVALSLCGYDTGAPEYLQERRERWLAAAPHDTRPGQTAVRDVDPDLLTNTPDQIRYVLNHAGLARSESNSGR